MAAANALRSRLSLLWQPRPRPVCVPSGVVELDAVSGGLPRGAITEIHGPASSGRTSLLVSILTAAVGRGEICALVDTVDVFDPVAASAAGLDCKRLLWVRCGGNAEYALKAVDLLIHGGGFGVVAFDIGDVAPRIARRIPLASWFRLRRAIEDTPSVLVVLEREQTVKSCAALVMEMSAEGAAWSGARGISRLLRGTRMEAALPRKPACAVERIRFEAKAIG